MKIICPSCRFENEVESRPGAGLLLDASCTRCGAILPAAGAQVLDDLRSELENEVSSIVAQAQPREVAPSAYRIGGREAEPARSISNPAVPAYKVVESSSEKMLASPDLPLAPAETAPSEDEPWTPAASELNSLAAQEFVTAQRRKTAATDDDMLKPPEIRRAKSAPEPEVAPPPAFDGDFKGLVRTDPGAVTGPVSALKRSSSMISQHAVEMDFVPRRNTGLMVMLGLGLLAIVGLLAVILVLLLRQRGPGGEVIAGGPGVGTAVAMVGTLDAGHAALVAAPDASLRTVDASQAAIADAALPTRADAARIALAVTPTPAQPVAAVNKPIAVKAPEVERPGLPPPVKDVDRPVKKPPPASPGDEGDSKPPPRRTGQRPAGCDEVLFPDPLDCPTSAPPGKQEILDVVRGHLDEIDACAKQQHAIDPELASGTVTVRFWIRPTGRTGKVQVMTEPYKDAPVGACLKKAVESWHFGAYDGKPVGPINFPFKLKTN
ncbi:MAG: AgmX/PglI C-terminal domain-containing protein [Pseudomonadota bacterium]